MTDFGRLYLLPGSILLALSLACAPLSAEDAAVEDDTGPALVPAEIATVGVDHLTGSPIVLLRDLEEGRTIPIWIGLNEAQAISRGLHNIETPRPMTHDLLGSLIEKTGYTVKEVSVHDLRHGTYYGSITLSRKDSGEELVIDSRPSDALAVAVRTNARITIAARILEEDREFQFVPPDSREQVVRLLGLTVVALTAELAEELGWTGPPDAVVVSESRGQARERGLQKNDIILEANGEAPDSPIDLLRIYMSAGRRETLKLQIWRDGDERSFFLPLDDAALPGEGVEI